MRYRTADGATFSAGNPEELIKKLREKSFTASFDVESFMQQTAKRAMLQSSKHVRTDSAAHFVNDLIAAELLTAVKAGDPARCEKCGESLAGRRFMQTSACTACGCVQNPPQGNGAVALTSD